MSDFLSEVDRHILARANFIPRMITDPVERENVELLFDLLRQHVDHVAEQQQRIAELEQALRAMVDKLDYLETGMYGETRCYFCETLQKFDYQRREYQPEEHAPNCPVMAAKKLLEGE